MSASNSSPVAQYRRLGATRGACLVGMVLLVGAAALAALSLGGADLSPVESLRALFGSAEKGRLIVRELRLPRVLMALLVGSGLAMGGTVCQAVLKNPLASPFTLGVASGAAFGAVLAIVGEASAGGVAAAAFAGALATAVVVIGVARVRGATPETLILSGVALMFLFSACTSLLQYVSSMQQVAAIVFWMFGSLSKAGWREILLALPMIGLPALWLMRRAWDLNLLAAGEDLARTIGVNANRVRHTGLFLSALMCAGAIAFTGVIGFVGLMAPHMGRMLLGNDHRFLIPASGLIGGLLVVVADTLGRVLWAPQVIPIGIMTSFIGVPFFVYLLLRRREAV